MQSKDTDQRASNNRRRSSPNQRPQKRAMTEFPREKMVAISRAAGEVGGRRRLALG